MKSIKHMFIPLFLTLVAAITTAQPLRPFPTSSNADSRFDPTGWLAPNAPSIADGDLFGFSIAVTGITPIEAIAIVGAPHTTVSGHANAGLVYVYGQNLSGGWDYITTIADPDPAPDVQFGYAVDIIDEDGNYLIAIGAPGTVVGSTSNAGQVHIYRPDGSGGWTHEQAIRAPTERDGRFGSSVALANLGDNVGHLMVGEPNGVGNAHLYTQFSSSFSLTTSYEAPQFNAGFGHAVEFFPHFGVPEKYDFLISAPYQDDTVDDTDNGAIYHYAYDGVSAWELEDTITSEYVRNGALFGWSMDVYATSVSDARLVIGSPNFELYDASTENFVPGAGIAEIFIFDGTFWSPDDELYPALIQEDMNFGAAVSVTQLPDANYSILVGQSHGLNPTDDGGVTRLANTPGAVHQFLEDSPSLYILYTTLDGQDLGINDHYGFAIADATLDGQQHILIGAPSATHPVQTGNPATGGVDTYYPNQPAVNIEIDGGGILEISEDGVEGRFYIYLNTRPADATTTTVHIVTDDQCYVYEEIGARPPDVTLNFSSSNWSEWRGIIVIAENDTDAEGLHACVISFILSSDDPNYSDLTIPPLTAFITDDEILSTELARNGGMEDPVVAKPFKPINWTFRKLSPKDKRICPGSGSPKVHSGNCSVQMNGTADAPRSVLRSTRTKTDLTDNLGLPLAVGDTLRVQFKYKLHRKTDALVRLVAFRNFGGDRTVLARVELPHPLDEDYTQWLTFDQTFTLTTTDFKQLRLILRDLSKGGNWWIDDVSLLYTPDEGGGVSRFRAP